MTPQVPAGIPNAAGQMLGYPIRSGYYYDGSPGTGNSPLASASLSSADRLYARPFTVPRRTTWSHIHLRCTTADPGKKTRLGVYAHDWTTGLPAARLYVTAEFTLDAVGAKEEAFSGGGLTVDAGIIWLAMRCDSSIAAFRRSSVVAADGRLGCVDGASDPVVSVYSSTGTYALTGIPDPFPASPTEDTGTTPFRIMLKAL